MAHEIYSSPKPFPGVISPTFSQVTRLQEVKSMSMVTKLGGKAELSESMPPPSHGPADHAAHPSFNSETKHLREVAHTEP